MMDPGFRGMFIGSDPLFGVVPMFIIWNIFVILLVAAIFYWLIRSAKKPTEKPLDVLKRRYAAGEIDKETFLSMKKDLAD